MLHRVTKAAALLASAVTALAGLGSAPAARAGEGWHPVQEKWQPYQEGTLTLPAARYCGDFTLELSAIKQGVRRKVLTRWDNGTVRTEFYAGVLQTLATNLESGASTKLNLSGTASVTYRSSGSMQVYEMNGPVGMGWPTGSDPRLHQGYYRFVGHHVVTFTPEGQRSLVVAQGQQQDVCAMVR